MTGTTPPLTWEVAMCDRHASLSPLAPTATIGRRSFLKRSSASSLVVAVPALMGIGFGAGPAWAADKIRATHGGGFCNLGIFLSHARQFALADGVELEFAVTPTFADMVTLFGAGQVDMSVIPYTNFLTLYDAGAPVSIVGGGGVEGCVIVARPGLDSADKLKGKTLGTFQADTLEILPYDWLKMHGVNFADINVRYMGTTPETVEAFVAGALDWICTIEPYGQAALERVPGAVMLSDGRDVYGKWYPDCVLAARRSLMDSRPELVKAIIKGMMQAQHEAETDREGVLQTVVGPYYKTSMEAARIASEKQPVMVDMRHATDFILNRADSLLEIGYIKQKPQSDAIDWGLLEATIAENQELFDSLEVTSLAV
jgi:NitT/TauT family transport system substrate-binding protein